MNEKVAFYKEQIEKYEKLKQTAPDKQRVEDIIRMYKEELSKINPGLNSWMN